MSARETEGNIEKTYQKKTQLEHILLRPDTYIGTTEKVEEKLWVYDSQKEKLVYKTISYVPGLFKIFDEILVNAVDNITRDLSMNSIKVTIDSNSITIYNNGKGIPVTIHKTYKIYVPELIFGHLLTSSNYDDSIKKITGGRNGFGAKLTNIFSKRFTVKTADKKNKKSFMMEFTDNMAKHSEPQIESNYSGEDYTEISFEPDFKKFRMSKMDDDLISLLKKRVYDVAGTSPSRVNVYLNNKKISVKTFNDYIDLYLKDCLFDDKIEYPKIAMPSNERWEVAFSMSDNSFQQVSFVNGICTSKGGTHVNYIIDQVTEKINEYIKKKHKDMRMNSNQIKQNLWVFINCFIENPSFDSQTKETLTTKESNFGSECVLTDALLNKIVKSPIVTNIVEFGKAKQRVKLTKALSSNIKKASRLLGIEKLEDANLAGTKDSLECTLIITEGDSAKALALAGIEVAGRDKFGVFPIKGKFLNVRNAMDKKIINNQEVQNVIKILGLKMNMDYSDELKGLRYGKLMIMTDQDYDGSHIKGLIINFIHYYWPSLIKRNDFIQEFITPLIKATKQNKEVVFFTMKEYNDWYSNNNTEGWKIKYYKGLGTSTTKEAKEYFKNLDKNRIKFIYKDNEDDQSIELAYDKNEPLKRKNWLMNFEPLNTFIDHSIGYVSYKDFINKELIFFSNYDNFRSIPSLIDGLKPSERKILYGCFKRNLRSELKVAQLTGYIAEHSSYHHGEASLNQTITAMAQDFVGSNNLNLLLPIGQFGSRYSGIEGAASPRYIFTMLNPLTRKLFLEEDDTLLMYNVDEGSKIEPFYYAPIIPSLLINGAEGIGTGYSTSVPQFNPIDLANHILSKINKEEMMPQLIPWYRGYTGDIKPQIQSQGQGQGQGQDTATRPSSFVISGRIRINDDSDEIEITELPIHTWIRDYKTFLEKNHCDNKDNSTKDFEVTDIKEYHCGNKISFVIKLKEESMVKVRQMTPDDLLKTFKLTSNISTSNMVLFDSNNKIKKYSSIEEIIDEFYTVRLEYYEKRREYLLAKYGFNYEKNENKLKFIQFVLQNEIQFRNVKNKVEILSLLKAKGLMTMKELKSKHQKAFHINSTEIIINEDNSTNDTNDLDYDYLMSMNIWSLTPDKINELTNLINKDKAEYDYLMSCNALILWKYDIVTFIDVYKKHLIEIDGESVSLESNIEKMKLKSQLLRGKRGKRSTKNAKGGGVNKGGKKTANKKKKDEDSFIDEDEDGDNNDDNDYSEYSDDENDDKDKDEEDISENEKEDNSGEKKKRNGRKTNGKKKNSSKDKSNDDANEEEDENITNKIKKNPSTQKKKLKKPLASLPLTSSNKKNKMIIDDGNDEIDENDKASMQLKPEASSLLKTLDMETKNLSTLSKKDPSTLSLKERLALRAKQGQIDEYFKAKNSSIENIPQSNIEITTEDLHNDFLGNKTKPSKPLLPPKTQSKASSTGKKLKRKTKRKDSDDDNDDDNSDESYK